MRRTFTAATATLFLVVALASQASAVFLADPDDADGRLDIVSVRAVHDDGTIVVRVETERGYGCRYFRPGGPNRMAVLVDEPIGGAIDYVWRLKCRPDGWIVRGASGFGTARHHPNTNIVVMEPPSCCGVEGEAAIVVRTRDATEGSCSPSTPCIDRAPNTHSLAL
jgi:hypothetical protein